MSWQAPECKTWYQKRSHTEPMGSAFAKRCHACRRQLIDTASMDGNGKDACGITTKNPNGISEISQVSQLY